MTAGRGIVHSERSGAAERAAASPLHGLQSWVALPAAQEECDPAFSHHAAGDLPVIEQEGVTLRLIAGRALGATAPVPTVSDLFYLHAELRAGASVAVPEDHPERAVYLVSGAVTLGDEALSPGSLAVLEPGGAPLVTAGPASRVMLLGGAPLESGRHIWWNFVSSRPERIEQAKADWRSGRFAGVPGDATFIPLPDA
jgi:redox-sensitive bicupin YhaK (pirin superfamily)